MTSAHTLNVAVDEMGVHEYWIDCPPSSPHSPGDCRLAQHPNLVEAARQLDVPKSGGEVAVGRYPVAEDPASPGRLVLAGVQRCVASKHIPWPGATCNICGATGMREAP